MSLAFATVRAPDRTKLEAAMQAWVAEHPDASIEAMDVHRDEVGHWLYSLVYREGA